MQCHGRTEIRTVRYNGQLIDIEGTACLISAFMDITDRKRLESQLQQSQKLEAVGRLAGGIAHDFNNMLAVILGQADRHRTLLRRGTPPTKASGNTKSCRTFRGVDPSTAGLCSPAGRRSTTAGPEPGHIRKTGDAAALDRRERCLEVEPSPSPWSVKMDPTQVDQILINLAVNARDAITDVGTLTISTENRLQEEAQPQWVILTVTDTGTGMDSETLAHLFEPFFTTKEIGKGTGMGLATVYGIVQHSGGRIEVESELARARHSESTCQTLKRQ